MPNKYKSDFPLLSRELDGMPITYLDSASTTPKPRTGHRRGHALLHRDGRQRASRRASARRSLDAGVRARAPRGGLAHRRLAAGDRLHAQRHRVVQPGRAGARPQQRRRGGLPGLRAPLELHALAAQGQDGARRHRRRGGAALPAARRAPVAAHPAGDAGARLERDRRGRARRGVDRHRARSGRAGDGRRLAVGLAPADRRAASSTATSSPSRRTRSSARRASACSTCARIASTSCSCGTSAAAWSTTTAKIASRCARRRSATRPARPTSKGAIGLGAAIEYVRAAKLEEIARHSRALGAQLVAGLHVTARRPGARRARAVELARRSVHGVGAGAVDDPGEPRAPARRLARHPGLGRLPLRAHPASSHPARRYAARLGTSVHRRRGHRAADRRPARASVTGVSTFGRNTSHRSSQLI